MDHGNLRTSRSLGRHELGEEQPRKPEGPDRRGRLRPDAELQPGPHPRIRADRLEEGHQRSRDPRHRVEGRSRIAPRPPRDLERRPDRLVRRLQQLVRGGRCLGLKVLEERKGVTPDKEVIAYCRIGERSSHTWFVLKYLLGYPNVRNYDGSWTEWGNLVRTPIEKP